MLPKPEGHYAQSEPTDRTVLLLQNDAGSIPACALIRFFKP